MSANWESLTITQRAVLKSFCPAPELSSGYYPMLLKFSFAIVLFQFLLCFLLIKYYEKAMTVANATYQTQVVDEYERGLLHGATDAIDQAKEDLDAFRGTATREEIAGVLDRALRASLMERRQGGWGV